METTQHERAPELSEGLKFLVTESHAQLFDVVAELLRDGGAAKLGVKEKVRWIQREGVGTGFRYLSNDWIQGHWLLSFLPQGGFCVHRSFAQDGLISEFWDLYDSRGELRSTQLEAPESVSAQEAMEMDLRCPLLDLCYNFLAHEYGRASAGTGASTDMVHAVERFLRKVNAEHVRERRRDPLIRHVFHKMLILEADPVLTWDERQLVYSGLMDGLKRVLKVKRRALGRGALIQNIEFLRLRWASFARRFKMRPLNNAWGLFYQHTISKIIWFVQTVKGNLGYSVALAVYGPFTYYFITMPMNPHAMQAVGTVRSTYLDLKSSLSSVGELLQRPQAPEENISLAAPATTIVEASAPLNAAPTTASTAPAAPTPNGFIGVSEVTRPSEAAYPLQIAGKRVDAMARYLNFVLTPDVPAVDQVPWRERMGNFKQMQIAYEEALEFAPRLGRLEQLETQYNFPMVVESAWEEMERYNNRIFKIRQKEQNLSARMKQYLTNEVNRTQQLELYLWDRLARFILDQPYVMLDQDREQKRSDYYVGRAFVFMEEMTQILGWRYPDFKKPHGYEKITEAADRYKKERKELGNILSNLKANSDLFRQKDAYSTAEFRAYMKRQWEILYLQNAKVEEASNNGLNMYIWSVRNTVWCLQSLYSAKRHFFNTHFRIDRFPMDTVIFSGRISKTEMLQERRKWYDRLVATGKLEQHRVLHDDWDSRRALYKALGFVLVGVGLVLLGLIIYAFLSRLGH